MGFDFDANSPIYLQLLNHFRKMIISSQWLPGERMASVRDLALQFKVNPNTVQRALADLERDGLAQSERTSGRYITNDSKLISAMRQSLAEEKIKRNLQDLSELGLNLDECITLSQKNWPKKGKDAQ